MTKSNAMVSFNDTPKKKGPVIENDINSVALLLTSETSDKYVPAPSKPSALGDLLI